MIKYVVLSFYLVISSGCNNNNTESLLVDKKEVIKTESEVVDASFDSLMINLTKEYPNDHIIRIVEGSKYFDAYKLTQRRYYPELFNLTFDTRNFVEISHTKGGIVNHVYNDSVQVILPFTDINYLTSGGNSIYGYIAFENLGKQLNHLLDDLHIDDLAELEFILNAIMGLHGGGRIHDEMDYHIYTERALHFLNKGTFYPPCKAEIGKWPFEQSV